MRRVATTWLLALVLANPLPAQEPDAADTPATAGSDQAGTKVTDGADGPRALSGMSILGNEEAPKSLVIIPWKSSELGDDISLGDTLDERAQPVDRDVFLRELNFYRIREGERPSGENSE